MAADIGYRIDQASNRDPVRKAEEDREGQTLVAHSAAPNPSIERTSQRPLRVLCAAAHVKR